MKRQRYAWVTILPASWLVLCTVTASLMKLFASDPRVGFLAHASRFADAASRGEVLAPAKSLAEMQRIVMNDRIDAALCALFLAVVVSIVAYGVRTCLAARRIDAPSVSELPATVGAAA
jgi:carbon starvation protein